jgi:hypothetical protein
MNRLIFQKLKEFEESFRTVSLENPNYDPIFILYDEVELMTGAKREVVEKLDFNDLKQIVEFIMQKYYGRKAPEIVAGESVSSGAIPLTPEQEEKNRLEPGVAQ